MYVCSLGSVWTMQNILDRLRLYKAEPVYNPYVGPALADIWNVNGDSELPFG